MAKSKVRALESSGMSRFSETDFVIRGTPFHGILGQLFPVISLCEGGHITANFGHTEFKYKFADAPKRCCAPHSDTLGLNSEKEPNVEEFGLHEVGTVQG
jgi:hypothetical protein